MNSHIKFVPAMKRFSVRALVTVVVMLGLGHTANATVVKVDLSTTTGPKAGLTNWNYLVPNSSIGAGSVIDAAGSVVSGLSVSVNGSGAGNDPSTLAWTGFGNDPYYVPAAYDLIYAVTPGLGLLGQSNEMNVSFSGLDTSKTYNARVYFLINEGLSNFDAAVSGQAGMVRNNNINRVQVYNQPYLDSRLVFTNVAPTTSGGNLIISVGASQAVSLEAVVLEQPSNAYWAPASGAGGSGTWTGTSTVWSDSSNGSGGKSPWSNATGVGYFGGTAGTVTVTGTVGVNEAVFTTGGYVLESSGGQISYYASGTTATVNAQTGLTTIAANQAAATGLQVTGNGTLALSATTTIGSGQSLVVAGGNLRVNGLVSGSVNVAAGSLGGSGQIQGGISGAGLVSPGNSPGILTVESVNPSAGLDFALEFSGTAPNYGDATNSVNDVLRLTGGTPFTTGLTSANTKTLFLNFTKAQLTVGGSNAITTLEGGFFTDAAFDFTSLLNNETWDNAGFEVYVYGDGQGKDNALNGVGYYNWRNPAMFGWTQSLFMSTTARTANFASGSEAGQVMLLTIAVPEPSTYCMALAGLAYGGYLVRRRRRRTMFESAAQVG